MIIVAEGQDREMIHAIGVSARNRIVESYNENQFINSMNVFHSKYQDGVTDQINNKL